MSAFADDGPEAAVQLSIIDGRLAESTVACCAQHPVSLVRRRLGRAAVASRAAFVHLKVDELV